MSITVKCGNPSCGRVYQLGDEFIGKAIKCSNCGSIIRVPGAGASEGFGQEFPAGSSSEPTGRAALYPTTHGLAIASLILGIVALVLSFIIVGVLPGIIGLILGIVGLAKISKAPNRFKGKGLAAGGIVTGCLAIFIALLVGIMAAIGLKMAAKVFRQPEVKAGFDLERIYWGFEEYRKANGKFPENLQQLPSGVYAKLPVMGEVNPADYEYLGETLTEEQAKEKRRILAYAKQPLQTGERMVLLLDGTPLILSDSDFQKALAGEPVPENAGREPFPPGSLPPELRNRIRTSRY